MDTDASGDQRCWWQRCYWCAAFRSNAIRTEPRPAPAPTHSVSQDPQPLASPSLPLTHPRRLPVKFDALKATNAYLATVSGPARAKSDAYFEGGYWLILLDTLYTLAVAGIVLWLHISSGIRNWAADLTRSRFWQVPIYIAIYTVVATILSFPLTLYEDFFREHAYGLSNQNFMQWFGDFAKGFGFEFVGAIIIATIIYAIVRATPRFWWLWGAIVTDIFPGPTDDRLARLHHAGIQPLLPAQGRASEGRDPFARPRQ